MTLLGTVVTVFAVIAACIVVVGVLGFIIGIITDMFSH